jgi:predicted metalloprotease with PDZ domain
MLILSPLDRAPLALSLAVAALFGAACDPPSEQSPAGALVEPTRPAAQSELAPMAPPAGALVSHRLSFGEARNRYVLVESRFPASGRPTVELMMAVWTPGSYLVREFSRHVESLVAVGPDGAALDLVKTRKNRWRVATAGAEQIVVRYRLYAPELTVRTNWVSDDMAVLNGAATFLVPVGQLDQPHDVTLELPDGWRDSVTALPPHPSGQRHRYLAPSYDVLVDSPILAGNPVVRPFEVAGVRHRLAHAGDTSMWEPDRAARDAARLVDTHRAFWGHLPYRSYDFLSVLVEGDASGGLEHRDSTLLISSPWAMRTAKDYARWLGLVSHEFFHAWNVKRLRPIELGPFDYENEVYTRSLWVAEGVTSYYDDLLVLRAGLIDRRQYLAGLSKQIRSVETGPGRSVQPLALSSFDAWIEFYRPDENSGNSTVSYYDKGAVVGFLLDTEIRRASGGRRSLDDVLRAAYERWSGARGYRPEELRQLAETIAGRELAGFWSRFVDGTAPLDYQPALDYYGLRFTRKRGTDAAAASAAGPDADPVKPHAGLETRSENGRLRVTRVLRDGPAWRAGVQPGDEILAVDERRIPPDGLDAALARHRPGARVTLLVSRWSVLRRLPVQLGSPPADELDLEVARDASAAQRARLAAWLDGSR